MSWPRYNTGFNFGYVPTLPERFMVQWPVCVASSVSNFVFRFAIVSDQQIAWRLLRNCSVTPAQLGGLYASLCVVSLGIASAFWMQGATMIMPFAWLELLVVGVAFLVYARHATDGERIVLQGGHLTVEQTMAGKLQRSEFNRAWVRVEPQASDHSLIELSGQGRKVHIGRHIRPELRPALAREIRMALRTVGV